MMKNLKRNWHVVSKLIKRIWRILIRDLGSLRNLHFNWLLLTKVYNAWAKKVQLSYISWHYSMMQNFIENWLVFWEMPWGLWQIFTRPRKMFKIGTFMTSFCLKLKIYELKSYRGVTYHDNKKWCKNWRGIDLSVQILREEFWPEHLKISNICILMGCFWPKYIVFKLKNYREVMFDATEFWYKIWRKTDLRFQKWLEKFFKYSPEHVRKSKNSAFDGSLFSKVENGWA